MDLNLVALVYKKKKIFKRYSRTAVDHFWLNLYRDSIFRKTNDIIGRSRTFICCDGLSKLILNQTLLKQCLHYFRLFKSLNKSISSNH